MNLSPQSPSKKLSKLEECSFHKMETEEKHIHGPPFQGPMLLYLWIYKEEILEGEIIFGPTGSQDILIPRGMLAPTPGIWSSRCT
jgi:hypothetical protein